MLTEELSRRDLINERPKLSKGDVVCLWIKGYGLVDCVVKEADEVKVTGDVFDLQPFSFGARDTNGVYFYDEVAGCEYTQITSEDDLIEMGFSFVERVKDVTDPRRYTSVDIWECSGVYIAVNSSSQGNGFYMRDLTWKLNAKDNSNSNISAYTTQTC